MAEESGGRCGSVGGRVSVSPGGGGGRGPALGRRSSVDEGDGGRGTRSACWADDVVEASDVELGAAGSSEAMVAGRTAGPTGAGSPGGGDFRSGRISVSSVVGVLAAAKVCSQASGVVSIFFRALSVEIRKRMAVTLARKIAARMVGFWVSSGENLLATVVDMYVDPHAFLGGSGFASGGRNAPQASGFDMSAAAERPLGARPFASVTQVSPRRYAWSRSRIVRFEVVDVDLEADFFPIPLVINCMEESGAARCGDLFPNGGERSLYAMALCSHPVCRDVRMMGTGAVDSPLSVCVYAPCGEFAPIGDLRLLYEAAPRASGVCRDAPHVVHVDGVMVTGWPTSGVDAALVAGLNLGLDILNPFVVTCLVVSGAALFGVQFPNGDEHSLHAKVLCTHPACRNVQVLNVHGSARYASNPNSNAWSGSLLFPFVVEVDQIWYIDVSSPASLEDDSMLGIVSVLVLALVGMRCGSILPCHVIGAGSNCKAGDSGLIGFGGGDASPRSGE